MRLPALKRRKAPTAVAISVDEPRTLDRIALMNATLIEVTADARLVEVKKADYRQGEMEVVVEAPKLSRVQTPRGVSIRPTPAS